MAALSMFGVGLMAIKQWALCIMRATSNTSLCRRPWSRRTIRRWSRRRRLWSPLRFQRDRRWSRRRPLLRRREPLRCRPCRRRTTRRSLRRRPLDRRRGAHLVIRRLLRRRLSVRSESITLCRALPVRSAETLIILCGTGRVTIIRVRAMRDSISTSVRATAPIMAICPLISSGNTDRGRGRSKDSSTSFWCCLATTSMTTTISIIYISARRFKP